MKKIFVFSLYVVFIGLISSCTVSYSTTGADIPAGASTFSVKTFQIATPMAAPNYNQLISESYKDLMLAQTRLDLIEKKGDLQYEGVVTGYITGNAAVTSDEVAALNRLTVTLKVKYINTLDRSKNFEKTFSRFADYPSTEDFNRVEASLIEDINAQLVQDIFDASLGAW